MVKDPPALNASCMHYYLSVFMCFENTNHSHLFSVMHGGIMMQGLKQETIWRFFVCVGVCVCVCVSLSLCVAVCGWVCVFVCMK